jgi:hypothetical protein
MLNNSLSSVIHFKFEGVLRNTFDLLFNNLQLEFDKSIFSKDEQSLNIKPILVTLSVLKLDKSK